MKNRKQTLALILAALTLLALAACTPAPAAPGGDSPTAAGGESNAPANSASPSASPSSSPSAEPSDSEEEDIEDEFDADAFLEEYYKPSAYDFGGDEFVIYAWWDSTPAESSEAAAQLLKVAENIIAARFRGFSSRRCRI